ncbi:MAG: heme exporter protein CcmB [Acidobacteriaceae bacterium]
MSTVSIALHHFSKDARIEWRSKDATNAMLFFALLVAVIFSFAFDPAADESRQIAGGIIWIAFLFASTLAVNQTWARELRNGVLDALRIAPAPVNAILIGKALGNFVFVTLIQAVVWPVFVVFYNLHVVGAWWQLIAVLLLGSWALVMNGTFFTALSMRTRNREVMLPLLLFPVSIPALLAMVEATTNILVGDASPVMWLRILAAYDVVFTMAGLMLFEVVLGAE